MVRLSYRFMLRKLSILLLYSALTLSSCIKDESPGREADIESMSLEGSYYLSTALNNNTVQLFVNDEVDLSTLSPSITLTAGAKVNPESGSVQNFSATNPIKYTVTAADGITKKDYSVQVVVRKGLRYNFENWSSVGVLNNTYPILTDLNWANANSGVALATIFPSIKLNDGYPTEKTTDSHSGKYAARLLTVKGGQAFGLKPIFSGSMFLGRFEVTDISNPIKSLKLGVAQSASDGKPVFFSGYYKYTPGPVFTNESDNPVPGMTDSMSVYAAVFKVSKGAPLNSEYLDGQTILTSNRIIARAEVQQLSAVELSQVKLSHNGYIRFSVPFVYSEDIDFSKYDYRLTIVCSSSKDGDHYRGAIGSLLKIDDLEIACDKIQYR